MKEALVRPIEGVVMKQLVTHTDERGFFREVVRETDDFFGHFGALKVALYDTRDGSPTKGNLMEFLMGDAHPTCVKIPPGVAHGCRALERSHLFYITSNVYSPDDEGRIPHDDASIGYDWTAGPEIK